MFAGHMRSVEPSFVLTEHNAPHVQAICERLDGLPLALELAAARAPLIGLAQLATLLRDEPGLLTGRPRPPQHATTRSPRPWTGASTRLDDADRQVLQRPGGVRRWLDARRRRGSVRRRPHAA